MPDLICQICSLYLKSDTMDASPFKFAILLASARGWPTLSPWIKAGALPFSRSLREGGAF